MEMFCSVEGLWLRALYMKLYLGEVGTALEICGMKLVMYAPSAERERGVHDSVLEEPFFMNVGRAKHTSSPWK